MILRSYIISFCILVLLVIVDPSNSIFGLKELAFLFTLILGLLSNKAVFNYKNLFICLSIGLILPTYGLLAGLIIGDYFSFEYALTYIKSFLFLFLLLATYRNGIKFGDLFSIITLIIVPLTIITWFIVDNNPIGNYFLVETDVAMITRRSFGPLVIDPVVFYKTSPLLIFGLSFLCSKNRFKYSIISFLLISLCLWTMFISGTRANMFSAILICMYYLWNNVIRQNKRLKTLFFTTLFFFCIFILPFILNEVFFNSQETSLNVKTSLISSYFLYWKENPIAFLFGSGLGSGIPTDIRGIGYMLEPTYFELIRFWGILLFPFICIFWILSPFYFFYLSRKSEWALKYKYILVAYGLYVFVEIPSNPLLISSTGMVVFVIVLSVAIDVYMKDRIPSSFNL